MKMKFISTRNDEGITGHGGLCVKDAKIYEPINGVGDGADCRRYRHLMGDKNKRKPIKKPRLLAKDDKSSNQDWKKWVYGGCHKSH